jgi:hypothetical protein
MLRVIVSIIGSHERISWMAAAEPERNHEIEEFRIKISDWIAD